ncbi:MAG TPA: hydroxyacylglutathione hydrolase [Burkholderiales bacterium]|nr:hydroxyacylglutathione hydrolase [Burkholderiales bacterium]
MPTNHTAIVPLRAFQDNYIWIMRRGGDAAVVDPGDAAPVLAYLDREGLRLTAILNTHHHADHVGGNAELLRHFRVPVYGPADPRIAEVSRQLRSGDCCTLAEFGVEFAALEIPGHTRTHIAFHGDSILFCGDTLFACGCGRLFEGTPRQMHDSLGRLAALPGAMRVYCGHEYTLDNLRFARAVEPHNPALAEWEREARAQRARDEPTLPSTIARETNANPFLRCAEPAVVTAASRHAGRELADPVSVFGVLREWKNDF